MKKEINIYKRANPKNSEQLAELIINTINFDRRHKDIDNTDIPKLIDLFIEQQHPILKDEIIAENAINNFYQTDYINDDDYKIKLINIVFSAIQESTLNKNMIINKLNRRINDLANTRRTKNARQKN